jgi:N-hydroxyarylamine O-acetyltransferase
MLDFDAYLERIGLAGVTRPTLHEVHRAHATSIPFENLDPHQGIPVSLTDDDLERKLVHERRGGYCFEQNLLLGAALSHIGLEVEPMLARVRAGTRAGAIRPRSHLVLRVRDSDGAVWHADVGFGRGTPLDPIPWGPDPDAVHEQSGWGFRVIAEGAALVLQSSGDDRWSDVYAFVPEPVPHIDIETSNWWTCTHPSSPFVFGVIAAVHRPDGSRELIHDWGGPLELITEWPGGRESSEPPREALPELLRTRFGLPGFTLGSDGRLRRAE